MDSRLSQAVNHIREQIDTLSSLSEAINKIRIIKRSLKKEVELVVGGNGLMLDLNISSAASQLTAVNLAKLIVATYQEALKKSMQEQSKQVENYLSSKNSR